MRRRAKSATPEALATQVRQVLTGQQPIDLLELMDLIHVVNPTGHVQTANETATRYTWKSRLQSLLIRRFADRIAIEPASDDGQVIAIRLPNLDRNACHALLSELDDDARSWVLRQLDTERAEVTAPEPQVVELPIEPQQEAELDGHEWRALCEQGMRAAERYEYTEAQQLLSEAFERSAGHADAAIPLLTLLVDQLGADVEALQLGRRLEPELAGNDEVRGLLATASVRAGDELEAARLVRGLEHQRARDALALWALRAAGRADRAAMDAALSQLRLRDPSHPALLAAPEALKQEMRRRRAPQEQAMRAAMGAGDLDEAERLARILLAEDASHELANRTLRRIALERTQREIDRATREAHAAAERSDWPLAIALTRKALSLSSGSQRSQLHKQLQQYEAAHRHAQDGHKAEQIYQLLANGSLPAALAAYAQLPASLRANVRARWHGPELAWMERLEASGQGRKGKSVVAAVAALASACPFVDSEPERFVQIAAPYEHLLQPLEQARRWFRTARDHMARHKLQQARQAVQRAQALLHAGQVTESAFVPSSLIKVLPPHERAEAEALLQRIEQELARQRKSQRIDELAAEAQYLQARDLASQLAQADAEARQHWQRRTEELQSLVQKSFRVHVLEPPALPRAHDLDVSSWPHEAMQALLADGALVVVQVWDGLVLARIVDRNSEVRSAMMCRTPEPLGAVRVKVIGDRLWLLGTGALELEPHSWNVISYLPEAMLAGPDASLLRVEVSSSGKYLWCSVRVGQANQTRIVDRRGRFHRALDGYSDPRAAGHDRALMLCVRQDTGPVLMTESGAQASSPGRAELVHATATAPYPASRGVIAVGPERPQERKTAALALCWWSPEGKVMGVEPIADTHGWWPAALASDLDQGLLFACVQTDNGSILVAYGAREGQQLQELYRVRCPGPVALVHGDGGPVFAALNQPRLTLLPLGDSPPDDLATSEPLQRNWFALDDGAPQGAGVSAEFEAILTQQVPSGLHSSVTTYSRHHTDDLAALLRLQEWLRAQGRHPERQDVIELLKAHHANSPEVVMLRANEEAARQRWASVVELLEPVLKPDLKPGLMKQAQHLLVAALCHQGRLQEAAQQLAHAQPQQARDFELWSEWVQYWLKPQERDRCRPVHALLDAIEAFERAADAWQYADAQASLHQPVVFHARELQSTARLAHAYLEAPPNQPEHVFDMAVALASFVAFVRTGRAGHLPMMQRRWSDAVVQELANRSAQWLEHCLCDEAEGEASGQLVAL